MVNKKALIIQLAMGLLAAGCRGPMLHGTCWASDEFAYVETTFAVEDKDADVQALLVSTVAPQIAFPFYLRRAGIVGTVRVTVRIGTDGEVQEIVAAEGDIREFVDAAVAGIGRCRFIAARKDGKAIGSRVVINVAFKIDEA